MAIEKALGIDAPPRAMHVRTILIEFSRMTSHLAFLSWLPWRVADFSRSGRVHHLLDTAHDLWEGFCGNRIHPMTCRIGGTAHDVTPVFAASLNTWCMHAAALSDELRSLLDGPAGACTRGVAVIPADAVAPFGLSGPLARASGVPMDLRCPNAARRRTSRSETTTSWRTEDSRDAPRHLAYDQVNFPVVDAPTEGDAHSRLSWLCAEVRQSADLVTTLLQSLPDGELATRLPTTLKVPAGPVGTGRLSARLSRRHVAVAPGPAYPHLRQCPGAGTPAAHAQRRTAGTGSRLPGMDAGRPRQVADRADREKAPGGSPGALNALSVR